MRWSHLCIGIVGGALAAATVFTACGPQTPAGPLTVRIEANTGGDPGEPLEVAFEAVVESDAPTGDLDYSWDFGDGSAGSAEPKPHHVYSQEGTYEVKLGVTDGDRSGDGKKTVELFLGVDLVVSALGALPLVVAPGDSVIAQVHVENQGVEPSPTTLVRFFLLSDDAWTGDTSTTPLADLTLSPLYGGEDVDKATAVPVPQDWSAGFYHLYAYVDGPQDPQVTEINEDNNLYRLQPAIEVTEVDPPPPTPTNSPTPTSSPSPTNSPTPTSSPSPTNSPTPTSSPSPTPSPSPTGNPTPSPTESPEPTPSPGPTVVITVVPLETPAPSQK